MKHSTEKPSALSSFKNAVEIGILKQWDRGLDILAEIIYRMEQNTTDSAWGRVGKAFRQATINGEIIVVGDYAFLDTKGRKTSRDKSMSAYLAGEGNDRVVLFVINRRTEDIVQESEKPLRYESYAINNVVNRLNRVRKQSYNIISTNEIDEIELGKLGLGQPLNELLEQKIRKLDTLE